LFFFAGIGQLLILMQGILPASVALDISLIASLLGMTMVAQAGWAFARRPLRPLYTLGVFFLSLSALHGPILSHFHNAQFGLFAALQIGAAWVAAAAIWNGGNEP